jgi:hypothetical protein
MANGIVLKGDWRKLRHRFGSYCEAPLHEVNELLRDVAEDFKQSLHEVVNSSPPPENKESTVKRKGFNNPLMETGGFMDENSIAVTPYFDNGRRAYLVHGNPDIIHSMSGLTYEDIVVISEVGGGNVPPREVLTKAYAEYSEEAKRHIISKLNEALEEG